MFTLVFEFFEMFATTIRFFFFKLSQFQVDFCLVLGYTVVKKGLFTCYSIGASAAHSIEAIYIVEIEEISAHAAHFQQILYNTNKKETMGNRIFKICNYLSIDYHLLESPFLSGFCS